MCRIHLRTPRPLPATTRNRQAGATATAAAHFAHASRLFANYNTQYPGYSTTLRMAVAECVDVACRQSRRRRPRPAPTVRWQRRTNGRRLCRWQRGLDTRPRVLAAAEVFKTTGTTTYRDYFDTWVKDASTYDGSNNPLANNWFDPSLATDLRCACMRQRRSRHSGSGG